MTQLPTGFNPVSSSSRSQETGGNKGATLGGLSVMVGDPPKTGGVDNAQKTSAGKPPTKVTKSFWARVFDNAKSESIPLAKAIIGGIKDWLVGGPIYTEHKIENFKVGGWGKDENGQTAIKDMKNILYFIGNLEDKNKRSELLDKFAGRLETLNKDDNVNRYTSFRHALCTFCTFCYNTEFVEDLSPEATNTMLGIIRDRISNQKMDFMSNGRSCEVKINDTGAQLPQDLYIKFLDKVALKSTDAEVLKNVGQLGEIFSRKGAETSLFTRIIASETNADYQLPEKTLTNLEKILNDFPEIEKQDFADKNIFIAQFYRDTFADIERKIDRDVQMSNKSAGEAQERLKSIRKNIIWLGPKSEG